MSIATRKLLHFVTFNTPYPSIKKIYGMELLETSSISFKLKKNSGAVVDVLRTTAAPTYFPIYQGFIDGVDSVKVDGKPASWDVTSK